MCVTNILFSNQIKFFGSLKKNKFILYQKGIEDTDVASCLRQVEVYGEKSLDEDGRERYFYLQKIY